jgi:hypothetical protein
VKTTVRFEILVAHARNQQKGFMEIWDNYSWHLSINVKR